MPAAAAQLQEKERKRERKREREKDREIEREREKEREREIKKERESRAVVEGAVPWDKWRKEGGKNKDITMPLVIGVTHTTFSWTADNSARSPRTQRNIKLILMFGGRLAFWSVCLPSFLFHQSLTALSLSLSLSLTPSLSLSLYFSLSLSLFLSLSLSERIHPSMA
jgi:hypothetical protein